MTAPAVTDAGLHSADAVRSFAQQVPDLVAEVVAASGGAWRTDGYVYQYTSMRSLCAMLSPGTDHVDSATFGPTTPIGHIWATAGQYMNDRREFDHGREVVLAACARASGDASLLGCITDAARSSEGLSVFCACFSGEDDHLGQWRGYGDNGRGCMLGFDLEKLARINGVGSWLIYGDHANNALQDTVSDRLVADLLDILAKRIPTSPSDRADFLASAQRELASLLPSVFLLFKDYAFRDEREYRVTYSEYTAPRPLWRHPHPVTRCFRSAGASVVPFVKLDFHNNAAAPLRLVRLGPAANWEANEAAVRLLLDSCNLGPVRLEKSSVPFVPKG